VPARWIAAHSTQARLSIERTAGALMSATTVRAAPACSVNALLNHERIQMAEPLQVRPRNIDAVLEESGAHPWTEPSVSAVPPVWRGVGMGE
jgi:hypothetical protein